MGVSPFARVSERADNARRARDGRVTLPPAVKWINHEHAAAHSPSTKTARPLAERSLTARSQKRSHDAVELQRAPDAVRVVRRRIGNRADIELPAAGERHL